MTRACFRDPIPEIREAAVNLDNAVNAYFEKDFQTAEAYIRAADMPVLREWTESLWGKNSPYVRYKPILGVQVLPKESRVKVRMPNASEKAQLHLRDGYHCRFCGIPVIRAETRKRIQNTFPEAIRWSQKNMECHAGFQAMWAQYDHILPHSKGGDNDLGNVVVTCAPCNFARMNYTLEEVGLSDPRAREPIQSAWDGLERFRALDL